MKFHHKSSTPHNLVIWKIAASSQAAMSAGRLPLDEFKGMVLNVRREPITVGKRLYRRLQLPVCVGEQVSRFFQSLNHCSTAVGGEPLRGVIPPKVMSEKIPDFEAFIE